MHEDLKNLLTPYFVNDLKRYGGNSDGAYILSERFLSKSKYIYSYGVGGNEESITFDRHMLSLNKTIYLYDGTINQFWGEEKNFIFKKENVHSKNISQHIEENNHLDQTEMVLKMDIEANEYETLLNSENLFIYFNQIAIELHGVISDHKQDAINLFKLLNNNYYLTHIHANNHDILVEDGVSNTLELTYIRKNCFDEDLKILPFSCPREGLDFPNYIFREDVKMDWWLK